MLNGSHGTAFCIWAGPAGADVGMSWLEFMGGLRALTLCSPPILSAGSNRFPNRPVSLK